MSLISQQYLATLIESSDKFDAAHKVSRRIITHIDDSAALKDEAELHNILQFALSSEKTEKFHSITIKKHEDKTGYQIGNRFVPVSIPPLFIPSPIPAASDPPPISHSLTIKPITQLAARTFPKAQGGIQRHLSNIITRWPIYIPAINLVWILLIAPILALYRTVKQQETLINQENRADFDLWKQSHSHSMDGICAAMEECVQLLTRKSAACSISSPLPPREQELLNCMTTGLITTKRVADCLQTRNYNGIRTISTEFAQHIEKTSSITLPSGYYRGNEFYPMLLSFFRGSKGELCLEKLSSDPKAQENQTTDERLYYTFADTSHLAKFLEKTWLMQQPSAAAPLAAKERSQLESLDRFRRHANKSPLPSINSVVPREDPADLFNSLIAHCGGVLQAEATKTDSSQPTVSPKQDSWDFLDYWIRHQFTEVPQSEKMILSLEVISLHLDTFLRNLDKLSPNERRESLPLIRAELMKFKKIVNKAFGSEDSFKLLAERDRLFTVINEKMEQIESFSRQNRAVDNTATVIALRADLERSASNGQDIRVVKPPTTREILRAATVHEPDFMHKHKADFAGLAKAVHASTEVGNPDPKADLLKAETHFENLSKAVEELAKRGDWSQAQVMATKVLGLLPIPSSTQKSFWDIDLGDSVATKKYLDNWGKKITAVTQCLWEAKLKIREKYMWPQQRVQLFKGRAILNKIGCRKKDLVLDNIRERISALRKSDPIFAKEEAAGSITIDMSLLVRLKIPYEDALDYMFTQTLTDVDQVEKHLLYARHLPSVEPEVEAEIGQLLTYFESVKSKDRYSGTGDRYSGTGKVITTILEGHGAYTHSSATGYFYQLDAVRVAYGGTTYEKPDYRKASHIHANALMEHYFPQISRREGSEEESANTTAEVLPILPSTVIDIRRHMIMTQILLESDPTLIKQTSTTVAGMFSTSVAIEQKEAKYNMEGDTATKSIFDDFDTEAQQILNKMGRLDFSSSVVHHGISSQGLGDTYGFINVVSTTPVEDSEAQNGLWYMRSEHIMETFALKPNRKIVFKNYGQPVVGKVSPEFVHLTVATKNPAFEPDKDVVEQTEVSILQRVLRDRKRPVGEMYPLSSLHSKRVEHILQGVVSSQQIWGTKNIYYSSCEALDLICQRTDLLENEEYQCVLEMALFKTLDIQKQLKENPNFFIARARIIKERIETALATNNYKTAAFLMHIGDRLSRHSQELLGLQKTNLPVEEKEKKEKDEKSEKEVKDSSDSGIPYDFLRNLIRVMPTYETVYKFKDGVKEGYRALLNVVQDRNQPQKYLMTFILDSFYHRYRHSLETIHTISKEEIAEILYGYAILQNVRSQTALPLLQRSATEWMNYTFLPELVEKMAPDGMQDVLNQVYGKCTNGRLPPAGLWRSEGSLKFSLKGIQLDVGTGKMTGVGGGVGPLALIPEEVSKHPTFVRLFGNAQIEANCSSGEASAESIYQFTVNRKVFRIIYNSETGELTIDRKMSIPAVPGDGWYRLHQISSKCTTGLGQFLAQHGVWKSLNGREAFAFIETPLQGSEDVFRVKISRSWKVEKMSQVDPDTGRTLVVCPDSDGKYRRCLPFVPADQLLVLRDSSSSSPTEIRVLGQALAFSKNSEGIWKVSEGKHKGSKWLQDVSETTNATAREFAAAMGDFIGSRAVAVESGKEVHFIIQPHLNSQTETHSSYLHVQITADGKIKSSAAGFLYLSYLFRGKGDLRRAHHYLEESKKAIITDEKDRFHFDRIAAALSRQAPKSIQQIAFQLKAELAISTILRQQTKEAAYTSSKADLFLDRAYRVCALHCQYQDRLKSMRRSNPALFMHEELVLSIEEEQVFEELRTAALEEHMRDLFPKEDVVTVPNPLMFSEPSSWAVMEAFKGMLLIFMEDPSKAPLEDLRAITKLSQENVLKYFWHYCKQIEKEGLTPDNLSHLLVAPQQALLGTEKEKVTIEAVCLMARDLLMGLSRKNLKENAEKEGDKIIFITKESSPIWRDPVAMQALYSTKKSLPASVMPPEGGCCRVACGLLSIYIKARRMPEAESSIAKGITYLQQMISVIPKTTKVIPASKTESVASPKFSQLSLKAASRPIREGVELRSAEQTLIRTQPAYNFEAVMMEKLSSAAKLGLISPETQLSMSKSGSKIFKFDDVRLQKAYRERSSKEIILMLKENGADFLETSRLQSIMRRIEQKERRLKAKGDAAEATAGTPAGYAAVVMPIVANSTEFSQFFQTLKSGTAQLRTISEGVADFNKVFTATEQGAMERYENEELAKGMTAAAEVLKKDMEKARTIASNRVGRLSDHIQTRTKALEEEVSEDRRAILVWAASAGAPDCLKKMSAHRDLFGDAAIVEKVLDLYHFGQLKVGGIEDPAICLRVTQFLLAATELQQNQKALNAVPQLKSLEDLYAKERDTVVRSQITKEYHYLANEVHILLQAGSKRDRYLRKGSSQQRDPHITRKYLTTEYRSGIILRDEQTAMIEECYPDPSRLAQMRMGLGKTATIMPLLGLLISEKNKLFVAIVIPSLFEMNRGSLNRSGRENYGQAAIPLHFDVNSPDSPADLAELYDKFLTAKDEGSYLVTTIDTKASIELKLTLLMEQLSKAINPSFSQMKAVASTLLGTSKGPDIELDPTQIADLQVRIFKMQQQIMWLTRINSLLDYRGKNGEENLKQFGFTTQCFADEGDEIFDVRREINMALPGSMRGLNSSVRSAVQSVMHAIVDHEKWDPDLTPEFEGDSKRGGEGESKGRSESFVKLTTEEIAQMRALRTSMLAGTTSALTKSEVDSVLKIVAKIIHKEVPLLAGVSLEAWVGYATKPPEKYAKATAEEAGKLEALRAPAGLPTTGRERDFISAIKLILSNTLESTFGYNPGIDSGLDSSNGCVVNPRRQKRELERTQFGDEVELTINHYLHYAAVGPSDEFLESCIRKMPFSQPTQYKKLIERAGGVTEVAELVKFLKEPKQYDLRWMICETFVMDAGLITVASEQITMNVHDVIRGAACGVASGTMNPASLPAEFAMKFRADSTRKVESETYLRCIMGKHPVLEIDDDHAILEMQGILADTSTKAIINEGLALKGMDTVEIIKQLRNSPHGAHRLFIFIHPLHKKEYMWMPGLDATAPVPFDPSRLDRKQCLFYFDPADTRGVDFKMPPGKVILIPGPTTVHASASQAAFRARLLGTGHTLQLWILASVAKRIRLQQKPEGGIITPAHVINDIKKRTLQEQAIYNYKAAVVRVRGTAFTGLRRKVLFKDDPVRHTKEYWDASKPEGAAGLSPTSRMMCDALANATLFGIKEIRDRMIQSKDIDFDLHSLPTSYEDTIKLLEDMYDSEIKELMSIKKKIAEERGIGAVMGLGAKGLSSSGSLSNSSSSLSSLSSSPSISSSGSSSSSSGAHSPFAEINLTHYNKRLEEAEGEIDLLIEEIERAKKEFIDSEAEMQKHLPKFMEMGNMGNQGTIATSQVLQQQLTQVQVKTEQALMDAPPVHLTPETYEAPQFSDLYYRDRVNTLSSCSYAFAASLGSQIYMTPEITKLIKHTPTLHKVPFAKLAVFRSKKANGIEYEYKICLVSKNDCHHLLSYSVLEMMKVDYAVFSLDYSAEHPKESSVGLLPMSGSSEMLDSSGWDDGLVCKCALARLVMGCTSFTEREKRVLKEWNKVIFQFFKDGGEARNRFLQELSTKCSPETIEAFEAICA